MQMETFLYAAAELLQKAHVVEHEMDSSLQSSSGRVLRMLIGKPHLRHSDALPETFSHLPFI